MKFLKTFEDREFKGKYWLVPTDDRFEDSLKQIGIEKKRMSYSHFFEEEIRNHGKYIFVSLNGEWDEYIGNIHNETYEDDGFEFGGVINIEDYELEAEKYNL